MTPDQERKHAELIEAQYEERRKGLTLENLHKAFKNLADDFAAHVAEDRKELGRHEDMLQRARKKTRDIVQRLNSPREKMPSLTGLDPDDSGSIDISILGSGAKFRGPLPVKIAAILLAVLLVGSAGYGIHAAMAHGALAPPLPTAIPGAKP